MFHATDYAIAGIDPDNCRETCMENVLWAVVLLLGSMNAALLVKIYLMRKAAKEIENGLADKLAEETNTLLSISSRDKYMRKLAVSLNEELRILRTKRLAFQQGDLQLKEAVTNISHDIRTPLTAICGYLELLKETVSQAPASHYLSIIENRTEALKALTDELLDYSVAAWEEQEIVYEDVILNHVLEESVAAYYGALRKEKITPDIYIPQIEVKCRLNKEKTSRIMGNILSNAIKYSDGDLQIILSENGEIRFTNHAPAMDEIQAGKLFHRFYTVDAPKKSTGLGLSIAKTFAEQMGGAIGASYQNEELTIWLSFAKQRL